MKGRRKGKIPTVEAPAPGEGRRGLKRVLSRLNPFGRRAPSRIEPWTRVAPLTAAVSDKNVLDKYLVDQAAVFVAEHGGKGYYLVEEPPLTPEEQEIYSMLFTHISYSLKPTAKVGDPMAYIEGAIWDAAYDLGVLDKVRKTYARYRYFLAKDAFGYGEIHVPMSDPRIEEISLTSYGKPVTVIHRAHTEFEWLETNIVFESEEKIRDFNQRLAQRTGKSLTTAVPALDSTTSEGDRIALTFGDEVTFPGSSFNIRKFPREPLSLPSIVGLGTLSPQVASYLWETIELGGFPMILGPFGSGKTTILNAILATIPPNLKIATVEDVLELQLPQPNWLRLHTRTGYSISGKGFDVTMFDLIRQSMRHRPNYLVVGEVRGEETRGEERVSDARALVHAAALGHSCVCSFHADSSEAALIRLRSPPIEISEPGIGLIWSFATMNRVRTPDGRHLRKVVSVDELIPKREVTLSPIFSWDPIHDSFIPTKSPDVVKLSSRLRHAAGLRGISDRGLVRELERKKKLLEKLLERGTKFWEFSEEMRKYYTQR